MDRRALRGFVVALALGSNAVPELFHELQPLGQRKLAELVSERLAGFRLAIEALLPDLDP